MAVSYELLRALGPTVRNTNVLALGYPDILATPEQLKELYGIEIEGKRDDAAWHRRDKLGLLPDAYELFKALGSTLECVDINVSRGGEKAVDLNYPARLGQFGLVLDHGTIEHCFNIAQALLNAAQAVRTAGYVVHLTPMNMVNHGFYSVSPTLYNDFYQQNGWRIAGLGAIRLKGGPMVKVPNYQRLALTEEMSVFCIAQKLQHKPLIYPTQFKYLANPDLKHPDQSFTGNMKNDGNHSNAS